MKKELLGSLRVCKNKQYRVSHRMLKPLLLIWVMLGADCGKEALPPEPEDSLVTAERELTDGEQPAVSPDGRKIAYSFKGDIFVMDTSGADIKQLTTGTDVDFMPRWHPMGLTIGFLRMPPGETDNAGILIVPANGGAATTIPLNHLVSNALKRQTEAYSGIGMPLWDYSPDGKYIGFLSKEERKTYLNVVKTSNNQHVVYRQIYDEATGAFGNTSCFAWSLNDDEIAFVAENQYRTSFVYLFNFAASTQVVDTSTDFPSYLTRAPNNNRFAYTGTDLPSQGGGYIRTATFAPPVIKYASVGLGGIKWSSDEKYFLGNRYESVSGPFGYSYYPLSIYNIETRKKYNLTQKADINRVNFYFEWAKAPNTVFFERFGKINEVKFQIAQ